MTALCVSCSKKETVTTTPDIVSDWVSPSAITAIGPDSVYYLLDYDANIIGNIALEGMPLMPYNGVFSCQASANKYYVYNIAEPTKRLNTEPFEFITDFRTGYAYATRPGRPLMVVNRLGSVIRVLPERISQINTAEYMTTQYASARFATDDECTGIMRPNGEIMIEFNRDENCGYLNDNRITVYNEKTKTYRAVDTTGKEIFTLDNGYSFTSDYYTSGWIGVANDDQTVSYFVDTDGNRVFDIDNGQVAMMRFGNVVITGTGFEEDDTIELISIEDGAKIAAGAVNVFPVPGSDMKKFALLFNDQEFATMKIIDDEGNQLNTFKIDSDYFSVPFGDNVAIGAGTNNTIYNYCTGKLVSPKIYDTIGINAYIGQIQNINSTYVAYAKELAGYFSPSGLLFNNYLYSAATTPKQVVASAGIDLSDDELAEGLKYIYNSGLRALNLTVGETNIIFTFDSDPYVVHESNYDYGTIYSIPSTTTELNPNCRLESATMIMDLGSEASEMLASKTLDYLIEREGFTRRADISNTVSNGTINIMIVPTKKKMFITVAFGEIDFAKLSSALSAPDAAYDPDASV